MDLEPEPEKKKVKTDEELLELAKKELLRETKCASMRAEQFGAHSWAKPQKYTPSKRFLAHMLVSASRSNNMEKHSKQTGKTQKKVTSAVRSSKRDERSRVYDEQKRHKHSEIYSSKHKLRNDEQYPNSKKVHKRKKRLDEIKKR